MTPGTQSPPATIFRTGGSVSLLSWPALDASGAAAAVTARAGGVSGGPYATLNLSLSVGDDPDRVLENRRRVAAAIGARPQDFVWARQVHGAGVQVVDASDAGRGAFALADAVADADALVTRDPGVVLAILTADCVPIVLHDPVAGVLACVHAGWRGTVAGVSAAALAVMHSLGARARDVVAGIGPAIAAAAYQVGPEVHEAVSQAFGTAAAAFIWPDTAPDRWLLDLWAANRHALRQAGVPDHQIHTTPHATGPHPAAPASPHPTGPHPTAPSDTASPTSFFSDRAARPCGRLALVARLRRPSPDSMNADL